ncbi:Quinone oxidoreductase [Patulibacter medicamentivorans]|jgi:NADPH2:quinone reductase|uniref:Quinone oxidoreductase n=1 Tax=Patulibacter medicamentivorans TaxID=1097667 RepID=H0E4E9_9ACTN|nr:NADPH:quinone oxidoreductase family protein [Patulibacter medicamentivorans]EHN11447.1 Quinone oxidoreductase [Patulibacter medicamentivorans]
MRAQQITELTGPDTALKLVDLPEPGPADNLLGGEGVVVEVGAAGVSFPELLQTRGMYQMKPPVPFVPGSEVGGVVRSAPAGSGLEPGQRVAAFCMLGGWSEVAVASPDLTFPIPDRLDDAQGAALILNYHTAWFALVTRGRLKEGESVLVHGAAGGVGTATLQVAKGLGARTFAVVSTDEKERIARAAGADEVVRSDGPWKDQVKELSGGGVDLIIDPVGGDRFTDSLRSLRPAGRLAVVGFTGGEIPSVKVNRLLLGNTEVLGAAWGEWLFRDRTLGPAIGAEIGKLIDAGAIDPPIGARFPLERAVDALKTLDERRAVGKVVLEP